MNILTSIDTENSKVAGICEKSPHNAFLSFLSFSMKYWEVIKIRFPSIVTIPKVRGVCSDISYHALDIGVVPKAAMVTKATPKPLIHNERKNIKYLFASSALVIYRVRR